MHTITVEQAWQIFRNSPAVLSEWEYPTGGGLILKGCPHCVRFQTRETYVLGFWAEVIELVTDYQCLGVSRCQCGNWCHWVC